MVGGGLVVVVVVKLLRCCDWEWRQVAAGYGATWRGPRGRQQKGLQLHTAMKSLLAMERCGVVPDAVNIDAVFSYCEHRLQYAKRRVAGDSWRLLRAAGWPVGPSLITETHRWQLIPWQFAAHSHWARLLSLRNRKTYY